jgi:glycosyltransferase involved in cell wall biosynthesis
MRDNVSVVISAYNEGESVNELHKELTKVMSDLPLKDYELIFVDDGSTDSTASVLREYERLDSRIKILTGEENRGLGYALNQCIKISKGEYIARHDLDDLSAKFRFEKQIRYLDSHREVGILGTGAWLFDENGIWEKEFFPLKVKNEDFLFTSPYKHGSVIFRTKELLKSGGYRAAKETLRNEDYDLF